MAQSLPEVYLARHGETEWSITGQTRAGATSRSPHAASAAPWVCASGSRGRHLPRSWSARARRPAGRASWRDSATRLRSTQTSRNGITASTRVGAPPISARSGSVEAIGARADRVVARLRTIEGNVLIFSHGHFLRVLAARWLGLPAEGARLLVLSTAALSVLGYEHTLDKPALRLWNDNRHVV
jgi:broad specificity phosphatase PhoE